MFESLSYFEKMQTLAFHKVADIYDDPNHPIHNNLIRDLESIGANEIEAFEAKYHYLFGRSGEDRDMDVRKMFFEYEVASAVARKRLSVLAATDKAGRQMPYNVDDFKGINVDEHGLVPVRELESSHFSFYNKGYAYQLCPLINLILAIGSVFLS